MHYVLLSCCYAEFISTTFICIWKRQAILSESTLCQNNLWKYLKKIVETYSKKTPTDICGGGCRCSFVLMWLFVLLSEIEATFKYNLVENISAKLADRAAWKKYFSRWKGFIFHQISIVRLSMKILMVYDDDNILHYRNERIFLSESEGVMPGWTLCLLECEGVCI